MRQAPLEMETEPRKMRRCDDTDKTPKNADFDDEPQMSRKRAEIVGVRAKRRLDQHS